MTSIVIIQVFSIWLRASAIPSTRIVLRKASRSGLTRWFPRLGGGLKRLASKLLPAPAQKAPVLSSPALVKSLPALLNLAPAWNLAPVQKALALLSLVPA